MVRRRLRDRSLVTISAIASTVKAAQIGGHVPPARGCEVTAAGR
ncbi:hypothetical protein [Sinorhizobium fredii]|uniref:Uncharacterized protein n=2 Tax=Rhizobium fredii TaxID=380 RepID=I3X3X3_SINF2|nr:hypothetical protein [Sinorhizobium fredii]AFL50579.1 hypothetical protein USDA257_c19950 [Sinorhizobium fredii USDA 257]